MLHPVEITPTNINLLFGTDNIPIGTAIIIKMSKSNYVTGKVTESRIFSVSQRMLIRIDKINDIFSYPANRFFLPYIASRHSLLSSKIMVCSATPSVSCQG